MGIWTPSVRVTVLKRFTLGLLKTENPKVVETCLGTLRRPHDLSTTQQDGSKACNSPRMVPVITFSFFTTIIPCKVGTKNTKSMKCHQIRRFCWLRLKTHKGEMKILCILAQQKWFQKSFFSQFQKNASYTYFYDHHKVCFTTKIRTQISLSFFAILEQLLHQLSNPYYSALPTLST